MRLQRQGREFYQLQISTDPPVEAWEASFDGGDTWVSGEAAVVEAVAVHRWLVAGPDAGPGGGTVIASSVTPMIRAIEAPETIVRTAPGITVPR